MVALKKWETKVSHFKFILYVVREKALPIGELITWIQNLFQTVGSRGRADRELGDFFPDLRGHIKCTARESWFQLIDITGADDRGGDRRMRFDPAHGQSYRMGADFFGVIAESGRSFEILRITIAFCVHIVFDDPTSCFGSLIRVLSTEQASPQWTIGNHSNLFGLGQRQDFHFNLPFDDIVHRFDTFKPGQVIACGDSERFGDLPGGPVAYAEIKDFSLPDQVGKSLQSFFHWRVKLCSIENMM